METIRLLQRVRILAKELHSFEIDRLIGEINSGNLDYGDKVTVTGIFSDFVPLARKLMMPIGDVGVLFDPLPCKPFSINGYYCASLQNFDSDFAAHPKGFPLFYKDSTPRPIMPMLSGLTVEVKGTLMSIPPTWKRLLDLQRPVGMNVQAIEIVGAEKITFGAILWAIVKSRKPFLKPSQGTILHADPFWWYNNRLGASNKYLLMGGGVRRIRHGGVSEQFDTVHDFYGVNLLDEEEYEKHKSALEARAGRREILAHFDMATLPAKQTEWLKRRIGL